MDELRLQVAAQGETIRRLERFVRTDAFCDLFGEVCGDTVWDPTRLDGLGCRKDVRDMTAGQVGDRSGPTFACREHFLQRASILVYPTGPAKQARDALCAKAGRSGGGVCVK